MCRFLIEDVVDQRVGVVESRAFRGKRPRNHWVDLLAALDLPVTCSFVRDGWSMREVSYHDGDSDSMAVIGGSCWWMLFDEPPRLCQLLASWASTLDEDLQCDQHLAMIFHRKSDNILCVTTVRLYWCTWWDNVLLRLEWSTKHNR